MQGKQSPTCSITPQLPGEFNSEYLIDITVAPLKRYLAKLNVTVQRT